MAKSVMHDTKAVVKYIPTFFIHTASAVILYIIFVGASKLTCQIGHWVPFEGSVHSSIFNVLELFFLILGAITASVYVFVQTWVLIWNIIRTKAVSIEEEPPYAGPEVAPTEAEVARTEARQPPLPIGEIKHGADRCSSEAGADSRSSNETKAYR